MQLCCCCCCYSSFYYSLKNCWKLGCSSSGMWIKFFSGTSTAAQAYRQMEERSKQVTAEKEQQKNMNLLAAAPPSVSSENTTYREHTQFLQELQGQIILTSSLASKWKQFNFENFWKSILKFFSVKETSKASSKCRDQLCSTKVISVLSENKIYFQLTRE